MIDLHLHTHYSDGKYSPQEVLKQASERGLKVIAFTDHDNAGGVRAGWAEAARLGIELVPGVEFTGAWPGLETRPGSGDIDLLGYFVDVEHPAFRALEEEGRRDISERLAECCRQLSRQGYRLWPSDLYHENPRFPSLTSAIQAMLHKGYAPEWGAAHRQVLTAWQRVRRGSLEVWRVIEGIHAAGGVAVLAHPVAIATKEGFLPEPRVAELVAWGLDGLEINHPAMRPAARDYFTPLLARYNLLASGGSDDHGWRDPRIGSQAVTVEMLEALRARANGGVHGRCGINGRVI